MDDGRALSPNTETSCDCALNVSLMSNSDGILLSPLVVCRHPVLAESAGFSNATAALIWY